MRINVLLDIKRDRVGGREGGGQGEKNTPLNTTQALWHNSLNTPVNSLESENQAIVT